MTTPSTGRTAAETRDYLLRRLKRNEVTLRSELVSAIEMLQRDLARAREKVVGGGPVYISGIVQSAGHRIDMLAVRLAEAVDVREEVETELADLAAS